MSKDTEGKSGTIEFRTRSGAPAITLTLSNATTEIHKSPEKLRKIMELLDLPEGATATVTIATSSTVVR